MPMLPTSIYTLYAISVDSNVIFNRLLEQIFQNTWNEETPHIATVILRKKNKIGGIMLPNIKLYYEATVIMTALYCHKNRHIDQWNRKRAQK